MFATDTYEEQPCFTVALCDYPGLPDAERQRAEARYARTLARQLGGEPEVANALRIAEDSSLSQSSTKEASKESDAERKKAEEKAAATDIGNVIRDALDKIDSQILQAIAESQELVKA